jgi:hypothetical protein
MVVVDPSGGGGVDPMFFAGGETGLGEVREKAKARAVTRTRF